jgi:LacI family transcriptional regulator
MHALLSLSTPPTAVLATSLPLALGALDALREQRVRVPDDIAVVGFDDGEAAEHAMLPLTMVRLPKFLMGKAAMAVVADQREGMEEAKHIRLPTELIIRASSGG